MSKMAGDDVSSRGRWALAAIFSVNGFLVGSWAPQIPVFADRLAIGPFTLGLLILLFGLGALVAMPACGFFIGRFGSRSVVRAVAPLAAFGLLAVVSAPSVTAAAPAIAVFGALVGGMDVSMNANAVAVERHLKRAIMSSSHGFWSLGGFVGGALGGLVIAAAGHLVHAVIVTAIALAVVLVALAFLVTEARVAPDPTRPRLSLPRNPVVYLTGLIALLSMVPEGAVLDWAAFYLRQERASDIATASFAFAAFSATMAVMRFAGDAVRNRLGAVTTLRLSAVVAAAGMAVAGLSPWPLLAVGAFALCGLGIANMVPIAFSAAGNQAGVSSGAGMSVATTIGYSGILMAPSLIGFVAERTGFAAIFLVLGLMPLVVALMADLVHAADAAAQPAE